MQTEFNLYKIDIKYIRNLHNIDDRVLSVSPQTGKDTRAFIGIVVICGKKKYAIPLSSPKEKHKKMKNRADFTKIEVDGKILGVLNFNLMIPVEDILLHPIDIKIRKRDRDRIVKYKELCQKEITWCNRNSENICNKANVLYKNYISDNVFSGRQRCLDFPCLELECTLYNLKLKGITIRKMNKNEYHLLKDFLYEAIFIPEGVSPLPKDIVKNPELKLYYKDFGSNKADTAFVAEKDGIVVGAVWTRIMDDYGHIDDDTPSFAISLYKEYRNQGIGTALMMKSLMNLKTLGFSKASLAVQKANYAVRMYENVGFKTVDENDEEYIMVCDLR